MENVLGGFSRDDFFKRIISLWSALRSTETISVSSEVSRSKFLWEWTAKSIESDFKSFLKLLSPAFNKIALVFEKSILIRE